MSFVLSSVAMYYITFRPSHRLSLCQPLVSFSSNSALTRLGSLYVSYMHWEYIVVTVVAGKTTKKCACSVFVIDIRSSSLINIWKLFSFHCFEYLIFFLSTTSPNLMRLSRIWQCWKHKSSKISGQIRSSTLEILFSLILAVIVDVVFVPFSLWVPRPKRQSDHWSI